MTEAETTECNNAQDLGSCCVCKENGSAFPTFLLSCLHSVCKSCSDAARLNDSSSEDDHFICATCGVSTFRYNFIENRLLKTLMSSGNSVGASVSTEERICTGCEENVPATSYCVECQEYLCDQCVQAHRRVKVTKEHNIQAKENAPTGRESSTQVSDVMLCHIHLKEPLKLFCETCDKLTCRDCQLSDHKDHKYFFVEEAGVKMRSVLLKFLERLREKKNLVENAKQLMTRRSTEIQECQDKVSNDIKVFALKIIAEINRRGKSLMEDLTVLCNAKTQQLNQKIEDVNSVCNKLDHAVKFIEYCTDKGSHEALLYSKRVVVKQLKNILMERCDVPNPNHRLDIRFHWDQNFISMVPKQGVLLVDGINFHTASKSAQQNWIQGLGLMSGAGPQQQQSVAQPGAPHRPPAHGPSGPPPATHPQQHLQQHKPRIKQPPYMMGSQQNPPQQHHQQAFIQPSHPGQISPSNSAGQPFSQPPHPAKLRHPPAHYHPQQSSAISSSEPLHRNRQGPYQNFSGNMYPNSSRGFPGPGSQSFRQQQMTLAELQEKRLMLMKKHGGQAASSRPGQPSPIVIAPDGEEHSSHLLPTKAPRTAASGSVVNRSTVSPHGSSASSPVHVGSTTSPDQQQRPKSAGSDRDLSITGVTNKSKLKGEAAERPSCSFSTSPKPSQVDQPDKRDKTHPVSISDFTFDQDPMSFIKNINQEIDLNPENTLGLLTEKRVGVVTQSEACSDTEAAVSSKQTGQASSSGPVGSCSPATSTPQPSPTTAAPATPDLANTSLPQQPTVGSSSSNDTLVTGKATAHLMSTQESSDPNEDWCAVCHNGGDLLCCDYCPKVFHLKCHVPTLKEMPNGSWQCNMCREDVVLTEPDSRSAETSSSSGATKRKLLSGLTDRELKVCQRILLELFAQEASSPFHQPVSKQVPNYYKVITNPMDFGSIKSRLRRSHATHYASVEQFLMDVQTVFTNCARYNGVESEMGVIGRDVEKFFHGLVRKHLPYIDIQPVSMVSGAGSMSPDSKAEAGQEEEGPPRLKLKRQEDDKAATPDQPEEGDSGKGERRLKLKLRLGAESLCRSGVEGGPEAESQTGSPDCGQATHTADKGDTPASTNTAQGDPATNPSPDLSDSSQVTDYCSLLDELPDLNGIDGDESQKDSHNDDPDYSPDN